jgi:predicted acylesterase/phospholipase RssA
MAPLLLRVAQLISWSQLASAWTAVVLSGGGAKGAFEVGVLQSMCEHHPSWANSWSMVLGTSIGALNAGVLAQFTKEEQCSKGVSALKAYWGQIRSQDDVFATSGVLPHIGNSCLSVTNMPAAFVAMQTKGGMCDPKPGSDSYNAAVTKERIQNSGMKIRVPASNLRTGLPRWWTEADDSIVDGCMASGSLAPFVYPKEVEGEWYVDGGVFSNTPILAALREGADSVVAVLLSRPGVHENITDIDQEKQKRFKELGFAVISFYMDVIENRVFIDDEVRTACRDYPSADIYGYVPAGDLGDLLDFDAENIAALMINGSNLGTSAPVDLCGFLGAPRGNGVAASGIAHIALALMGGFALALLCASLIFKRHSVTKRLCRCARIQRLGGADAMLVEDTSARV